jgi:hypothetical protein
MAGPPNPAVAEWELREIGDVMSLWWPTPALEQNLELADVSFASRTSLGFLNLTLYGMVSEGIEPLEPDLRPVLKKLAGDYEFVELQPPLPVTANQRVFEYASESKAGAAFAVAQNGALAVAFIERPLEYEPPPWLDHFLCQGVALASSPAGTVHQFNPNDWPGPDADPVALSYSLPGAEEHVLVAQDARGGWSRVRAGRLTAKMPGAPAIEKLNLVLDWVEVRTQLADLGIALRFSDMSAADQLPDPSKMLAQILEKMGPAGNCNFSRIERGTFATLPSASAVGVCVNNGHSVGLRAKLLADGTDYYHLVTTHLSGERPSAELATRFFESVTASEEVGEPRSPQ